MFGKKQKSKEEILKYYKFSAPQSAQDSPTYQRFILKSFLETLDGLKKLEVLDFGCGKGNNLGILSKTFKKVSAVDVSKSAIEIAKKNYKAFKNIKYFKYDGKKLPFGDQTFDFVVACEVLEHVPDLKKAFFELDRVVKSGGYIFISCPNYWNVRGLSKKILEFFMGEGSWDPGRAHVGGYERFMTPDKIFSLLKKYEIIKSAGSDYGTAWSFPMVRFYPLKFEHFFQIKLGQYKIVKYFGMNFYVLAQKKNVG